MCLLFYVVSFYIHGMHVHIYLQSASALSASNESNLANIRCLDDSLVITYHTVLCMHVVVDDIPYLTLRRDN